MRRALGVSTVRAAYSSVVADTRGAVERNRRTGVDVTIALPRKGQPADDQPLVRSNLNSYEA